MADQNLKSLFNSAETQRNNIESAREMNTDTFRDSLAAATATYEECRILADKLSLFSSNETLEDITTGDLE